MTAKLLDGTKVAAEVKKRLKNEVSKLKSKPGLAFVRVGEDPASKVYVEMKEKASSEVGIHTETHLLPESAEQEELLDLIQSLNQKPEIHGILLQLPLPAGFDVAEALHTISPQKDVDCLHPESQGMLYQGTGTRFPCTPHGIMHLLDYYKIHLEGKHAVVIGRSNLVGRPIARLLEGRGATVSVCHSKTPSLSDYTSKADVLVVATGKPKLITAGMVKSGAVVIDVGITRSDDRTLSGDVDFDSVKEKAAWITPVPGGVGPMTVAMLLENVVASAKAHHSAL